MEKFLKIVATGGVIWLIIVLVLFPKECIDAGLSGVFLCLDTVIPSLFPFFVCSGIITGLGLTRPLGKVFSPFMKPLFNVSGRGALPFVMGILSGYPVGAKCVTDLYSSGECSKSECEKLLAFCNNSGPMFILGAVGAGMIGNVAIGRYLYIIHILSAFLTGIILRFYKTKEEEVLSLPPYEKKDIISAITEAVAKSTDSIVLVCGYVIFFCVAGKALSKLHITPLMHGIMEITGGTEKVIGLSMSLNEKLPIVSGVIAFSSLSVILQVLSIIRKTNLSPRLYLIGKTIQGVLAFCITKVFLMFVPISEMTANITFSSLNTKSPWEISLGTAIIILILVVSLRRKKVDN